MAERFASDDDLKACRTAIRGGSKSFFAASLLLPRKTRDRAYALYGFCRFADDAVDEGEDAGGGVRRLTERLDLIYGGEPGDRSCRSRLRRCRARLRHPPRAARRP
jgi:phytoene synthase